MAKAKKILYWMENQYRNELEICVRAVIRKRGKILVCWYKLKKYYFFPGGHLDFGETAESALIRELKEELDIRIKKVSFIGIVENIYRDKDDEDKHHEINLVFDVIAEKVKDKSKEDHIEFIFFDKKDFQKEKVLPLSLQRNIIKWFKDKKTFWASQKEI